MTLKDVTEKLDLEVKSTFGKLNLTVSGGYVSDLLSDVIAHAREGQVWITLQVHSNIVAVAVLKELAGIILVNGRQPEAETLNKAEQEGVSILVSRLPAFEVAGRLFNLFR